MIFTETRYLLSCTLLLCTFAVLTRARSWDLAVVIGNEIDFFSRNSTLTGHANVGDAISLAGVTYDDTTKTMYLSDVDNNDVAILSIDLTEKENFTTTSLLKKEDGMHIMGIVFDKESRTLFWADTLNETIAKMHVSQSGEPSSPIVLHNLAGNSPRGVALDVCNSHIYWVNTKKASIERSNLDGSDRTIVIKERLYKPLAVAIDQAEQKMYWIDDVEGIHFKIERSNLDGGERELLIHSTHQQPVYLAIDDESVYWSDWVHSAVWSLPKNAKVGEPKEFKSYYMSRRTVDPSGIVTRDNIGTIDCVAILSKMNEMKSLSNSASQVATRNNQSFNSLITSTEDSDLTTESSKYCLNNGHLNKTDGKCRCKSGFVGSFCEVSLCHNYCLRGKCFINHRGHPECLCAGSFSGTRCEKDVCDGYCLHDGKCSVEKGKPQCSCKYSKGTRCEEPSDIATICAIYCANNHESVPSVTSCRCTDANRTAERITLSDSFQASTLLSIFLAIIALLLIIIVGLGYYVSVLRRRRVKKRFVVGKGVTPLTSRPQLSDQCEITIENCCNMNICETPCFEPKLRNAGMPRSNTKKEEKNSLLDNMEGNSC